MSAMAADFPIEPRILSGAEKAAALLLVMGKPLAARLFKRFDQIELRQITRAAAQLGAISTSILETLVEEFSINFSSGADLLGNAEEAQQMLAGALPPEQVADILSDVLGSSNSSLWEKINNLPEAAIAAYLGKEHPQTAAFILSKVSAACAAKVYACLPRDLRNELLRRMLAPAAVSEEAQRIVENALLDDLFAASVRAVGGDSRSHIAEIVNKLEPSDAEDMIKSLAGSRPKEAVALKKMLFSFDDLLRLSTRARATLFDKVSTDVVVLALRGTDSEFRDAVLSSMASRTRRLVESELNNGAVAPQREVAKARRSIADLVLAMAQRNEIELGSAADDEAA
jgi:flagellar motor switch protein FliG